LVKRQREEKRVCIPALDGVFAIKKKKQRPPQHPKTPLKVLRWKGGARLNLGRKSVDMRGITLFFGGRS